MDSYNSEEAKSFSPGKSIFDSIITSFLTIMGGVAILNGVFSLLHIWFGWFDNQGIRMGRRGPTLGWMDNTSQSFFIVGIGILFIAILWLRRQVRRHIWYKSHRLIFWIIFSVILAFAARGGYHGIIAMNGGNAIYAAQQCDTDTIRGLNEKDEIADTDKSEMLMRMAQEGCHDTLSYVLDQGWDVNTVYNNTPIVNTAASFANAKTVMMFIDHGANVNSRDNGLSLLMRVLQNQTTSIEEKKLLSKALISKGADINYKTPDGILSVDYYAKDAGIDLSSL